MDGVKHIQNIRKNGTPIIMRGERKPKVTKDSRNNALREKPNGHKSKRFMWGLLKTSGN